MAGGAMALGQQSMALRANLRQRRALRAEMKGLRTKEAAVLDTVPGEGRADAESHISVREHANSCLLGRSARRVGQQRGAIAEGIGGEFEVP